LLFLELLLEDDFESHQLGIEILLLIDNILGCELLLLREYGLEDDNLILRLLIKFR
jgi:hypothetical protein